MLEARLDRARGVLATVLVQDGTLQVGDPFIAGSAYGKVRAMIDEHGQRVDEAGPSTPVEVMGFAGEPDGRRLVPGRGRRGQGPADRLVPPGEDRGPRAQKASAPPDAREPGPGHRRGRGQGAADPAQGRRRRARSRRCRRALAELPSDKVRVNVLRSSIGAITQADVLLAAASNAIVVGFNVRPDQAAADLAKQEDVELRLYTVIYDLLDDIKQAMLGLLEPTLRGEASWARPRCASCSGPEDRHDRRLLRHRRQGRRATPEVRLLRDNVVIYTGKVGSLRRFKDDVVRGQAGLRVRHRHRQLQRPQGRRRDRVLRHGEGRAESL